MALAYFQYGCPYQKDPGALLPNPASPQTSVIKKAVVQRNIDV
jgi:hypothetical protein